MASIENDNHNTRKSSQAGDDFAWEVIEVLGQGVTILGPDGRFEYVNPAYARMVGRTPEELSGLTPFDVTHPEDHHILHQARQKRLAGESSTYETRLVRPDGTLVYAQVTGASRWQEGEVVGAYTIVTDLTKHKQAEKKLQESEAQLAGVIASAMDTIISVDESQHIVLFNAAAEKMFGCAAADVIGQPLDRFIPPRFRTKHRDHIRQFGQTGLTNRKMGNLEVLWALHADRREFPIEASISQVDIDGSKLYTVIVRDITAKLQAEEELKKSEELFSKIFHSSPVPMTLVSQTDGRYIEVNESFLRLIEYSPEEVIGRTNLDLNLIEPVERAKSIRFHQQNTAQSNEVRARTKSGRSLIVLTSIEKIELASEVCILTIILDITERKEAEEKLQQSETELQYVIDTVPEGILLLTTDGSMRLTNPLADQFLAILAPEAENTGRLTHLGQRPLPELLTTPPRGLWHDIAIDSHIFEAIARPVEISSENMGWVLVLRDVTQERQIQQHAQQQDRLAAVGQLAAGIAHDFNNIMAVITLYAQLIVRTVEMPPRAQEKLHTINQQAERATDLIQQILDFSRQSVLERLSLDLLPFMKELIKLLGRTLPEHIHINLEHTEKSYFIRADPSRIQQVLMNLAVNARDAMPAGGQLQISLAHVQTERAIQLATTEMPPGKWIQVRVSDSGQGIPPEVLPQIFEPFFTTKEVGKGTGLGLAQVYGIVQQHDGYIDVYTRVGQGTTFFLYFPLIDANDTSPILDKTLLEMGKGQLILLVEDDLATRQALVESLKFMNYEVIEAANGREALTILETKADHIALVLSDVVMPEMGGSALFHAMRHRNLSIPVILLTGHPMNQELDNLQALGLAGWMLKPPHIVNLSHLLAQVLAV